MNAGRGIQVTHFPVAGSAYNGGLSARQIFGLDWQFTMQELTASRRRLGAEFHPDRWQTAASARRKAAEATMKRINVAYDLLRAELAAK